jgi:ABC-type branched-subunit amino acid transport system ATPase component
MTGLVVTDVSVRYGGRHAVDKVSLAAAPGRITGLIGPNGAGKTSLFNAISGLVPMAHGTVTLDRRGLTRRGAHRRARAGLGRTFQRPALVPRLSVRENVALGHEGRVALRDRLTGPRAEHRRARRVIDDALELCALGDVAERPAGLLPLGRQRYVELARACAGGHDMILLDEPASGLDDAESREFGQALQRLAGDRGAGILLVEHDIGLVLRICDRVYVLDAGRVIFDGPPAQLQDSEAVRAAYLGAGGAR